MLRPTGSRAGSSGRRAGLDRPRSTSRRPPGSSNWGLMTYDGSPKPALSAFRRRAQASETALMGANPSEYRKAQMSTGRGLQRSTFLHLARPEIGDDEIAEVVDTLRSGWLVAGPEGKRVRGGISSSASRPASVRCLSSATAGLLLGLRLAGVGPGDEVIVPSLTFAACTNAVEQLGAKPVFVDSERATGLLDLGLVDRLIGPRTKAIMPVHLGGRPVEHRSPECDQRPRWRRDRGGRRPCDWRRVGQHPHRESRQLGARSRSTLRRTSPRSKAARSPYPTPSLTERVERLRLQGLSRSAWARHGSHAPADYELAEPGFKLTMSDVAAALGIHQLPKLDRIIDRREELAQRYDSLLEDLPLELEPPLPADARHGTASLRRTTKPDGSAWHATR